MIPGSTLLLVALAQSPPSATFPDPQLFDALVRTTNALESFSAEYRTRPAGKTEPATIRILYRAPDATKVVVGDRSIFRIQDGFLDARVSRALDKPMIAHLPIAQPILERYRRLAAAMRAEFPACADDWSDAVDAGIRFDLSVGDAAGTPEKTLQLNASYVCPRPARFGWLADLALRPCVPAEGDRLVFEAPPEAGGMRITLSTKTGFLERAEAGGATLELASLDSSPKLDDAAFEIPPPATDAIDASGLFAERVQQVQTKKHRKDALACVARLVAEKKIEWDDAARAHLAKVLETIHGDAWALESATWLADMRNRLSEFTSWFHDRLRDPKLADAASREQLEQAVAQWRRTLPVSAAAALESRQADVRGYGAGTPDEALAKDFLEIERRAVEKSLGTALVDPLLREFDEKIAEARKGL